MQFNLRMCPAKSAPLYPLQVDGEAAWQVLPSGRHILEIPLPSVPADHIIVPSLCVVGAQPHFQFSLQQDEESIALHPVPNAKSFKPHKYTKPCATPHIDCWHSQAQLNAARITLEVQLDSSLTDLHHLVTVSIRPLEMPVPSSPPAMRTSLEIPAHYSQMQAAQKIRQRICSPTALAMALSISSPAPSWPDTVDACFDPFTNAYGAWPLAIQWAGRNGRLAAVETFTNWDKAQQCLQAGAPLVCSIRWDKDNLDHAPMASSGGHLVLLQGLDPEQAVALALDPAAADVATVPRHYKLNQFAGAWLGRRGAAYIIGQAVG